jgi:hypothetical protein
MTGENGKTMGNLKIIDVLAKIRTRYLPTVIFKLYWFS